MEAIFFAGEIGTITTTKKEVKVVFHSQELPPAKAGALHQLSSQLVYIGIKMEPFSSEEKEVLDSLNTPIERNETPSQKLRKKLYGLWKLDNEGFSEFNDFYNARMDKFLSIVQTQIDALKY